MNVQWRQSHQAISTSTGDDAGNGGGSTTAQETGEVLTDRVNANLYYVGRLLANGYYRITRIQFDTGSLLKEQATGSWDDRASLTYVG